MVSEQIWYSKDFGSYIHKILLVLLGTVCRSTLFGYLQMLGIKEKEEEEIMKVYRDLSEENQQLRVQIVEYENQLQSQRYQIQTLEEAFQRSQSQVKTLDEESQRLNSDLKVIELNHFQSSEM